MERELELRLMAVYAMCFKTQKPFYLWQAAGGTGWDMGEEIPPVDLYLLVQPNGDVTAERPIEAPPPTKTAKVSALPMLIHHLQDTARAIQETGTPWYICETIGKYGPAGWMVTPVILAESRYLLAAVDGAVTLHDDSVHVELASVASNK